MMQPTAEQLDALDLFKRGESMVIEAGAGTGKTSTLALLAEQADAAGLSGRYMAFNKSIVNDVQGKMPDSCAASTAHSLAFRSVGKPFAHRLNAPRMNSHMLALFLDLDPFVINVEGQKRTLAPEFLAGHTMKSVTRFCQSADDAPSRKHVPRINGIDMPHPDTGTISWANNRVVAEYLERAMAVAWADITQVNGQLPFKHEHYLKMWHLSRPRTQVDYILFDEAQDANPVMAAVVAMQTHCQVVYVGDSNQAIYEFTGAVNALQSIDTENRCLLTRSFRFGPAIATAANEVLELLSSDMRLTGHDPIESTTGPLHLDNTDAFLCRSNARAVRAVMTEKSRGRRPHLVGGGTEVSSFAKAAAQLMDTGRCGHPEIACFGSWEDVQRYVAEDAQGGELRLLVKLVDEFGTDTIIEALDRMPSERQADVAISTAHKAKGRQWNHVKLADDFVPFGGDDPSDGELRLRYVAVTRAQLHLDHTALGRTDKGVF